MSTHPAETLLEWRRLHEEFGGRLRRSLRVAEEAEDDPEPVGLDERLVQCIWSDQLLRADQLRTASGKRVEVLDAGRWNTGRGPDFLNARVRLAGREQTGDVEIHLRSSGWTAHGHHQDFEYNATVLHVCLEAADDRPYEEKQNGARLERLVIGEALEPDLETIRRTINVSDYPFARPSEAGLCQEEFLRLSPKQLERFLATAGRARVEEKVARFRAQRAVANFDQLFYQNLMVGQGFRANKSLYFILAKRAPVAELADYASDVPPPQRETFFLSVLMHVASLMQTQEDFFQSEDAETRDFVEQLARHWRTVRPYYADRLLPPTKRWHSGMRPPGFPGRRLAAVAALLGRMADGSEPLFQSLLERFRAMDAEGMNVKAWREFLKSTTALLIVEGEGHYYQRHYTLGGKPCRPQALLGEPAARTLLFNVALPLLVLRAREEKDKLLESNVWATIRAFPALPKNSVTTFMKKRLLGGDATPLALFRTEVANQALLKTFQDCCSMNEKSCGSCTFLNPPYRLP